MKFIKQTYSMDVYNKAQLCVYFLLEQTPVRDY